MGYLALIFALGAVLSVIGIRQHRKNLVVLSGCIFISLGVVAFAGSLISLSCSSNPLGYGYGSGERCENAFAGEGLANPASALVLMAAISRDPARHRFARRTSIAGPPGQRTLVNHPTAKVPRESLLDWSHALGLDLLTSRTPHIARPSWNPAVRWFGEGWRGCTLSSC